MDPSLSHLPSTSPHEPTNDDNNTKPTHTPASINEQRPPSSVFRSLNSTPPSSPSRLPSAAASLRLPVAKPVSLAASLWRFSRRASRCVSTLSCRPVPPPPSRRARLGTSHSQSSFFFCSGSSSSSVPGHFVQVSRFSKTSGKSFLHKRCHGDLLYVSDPCEHCVAGGDEEEDLGMYRGVFRGFMRSRTRACLISKQARLENRVRCPYCGARVWSMRGARMVPKSASRRLGCPEEGLEYFVCVNGHLHGICCVNAEL
ncbi:uncharacterized protein A4U43_C07F7960 [Asparagus officinalis]|uniref:Uncharacterized protein n=1 Tax=Asparagus officinalis TaxID=4686 RepID=A0A5P1EFC5_ASPOF|nr:uncharacterized protein A4U43_C07F7960 [Asparagus officinalis]